VNRMGLLKLRAWAGVCAIAATLIVTGSALAAGSGYGNPGAPSGTPTGFTNIVTVRHFGFNGGSLKVRTGGGLLFIHDLRGAAPQIQIAITRGRFPALRRDLPPFLCRSKIITAFGIQLRQGPRFVRLKKFLFISFASRAIKKGEKVLIYDAKTGRFRVLGTPQRNGRFIVHLKTGETLVVVRAPFVKRRVIKHKKR
jgi:hypothetical protein